MAPSLIISDPMALTQEIGNVTKYPTPLSVRLAARNGALRDITAAMAPGHLQANLLVLPSHHAPSFLHLCHLNPIPCPLLAYTAPGDPTTLISNVPNLPSHLLASNINLSTDAPAYMIYEKGQLVRGGGGGKGKLGDIQREWGADYVGFLLGCSFGFEGALRDGGLIPSHWGTGRIVPMYRTNVPLIPAGVFTDSTYVVSMRPYKVSDIERVREITRAYTSCHGEPIAWGWDGMDRLGIKDLESPHWGDAPGLIRNDGTTENGEQLIPVFWGCGVTPQEAVMKAGEKIEGLVLAHDPGHMMVLDAKNSDLVGIGGQSGNVE